MKANEAPEKIYLQKYDNDTLLCLNKYNIHEEWTERPVCSNCATGNDIEYTRTDAFMDKAVDWLRKSLDNGCWVANNLGEYEKKVVIEHFKEAMKL